MKSLQILEARQIPDNKTFAKFRMNPPDICLVTKSCHCGLWWKNTPEADEKLGLIGHFFSENQEEIQYLLEAACDHLKSQGCDSVIGPMDGNTWHPYRFVTWSDGSSPFLMEPQNPLEWPIFWQEAGFFPYHEYVSTRVADLNQTDPRLIQARERLLSQGITWREIDKGKFADELGFVYQLSIDAFKNNILYTPIDKKSFLKQYLPFVEKVVADYVLIAQDADGECCGFVFAIPDLSQPQYGEKVDRLIIKTLAVSPGRQSGGLGAILVDEVHKRAMQNGLGSAIHALMYSKNNSTRIGKNSTLIRRYTLFGKKLT